MRLLNGCCKSIVLAQEFEKRGWDVWTCDILPSEGWHKHIQDDILDHLNDGWDLGIFHPDCTTKANSGVRWLFEIPGRYQQLIEDCSFFNKILSAKIRKPDFSFFGLTFLGPDGTRDNFRRFAHLILLLVY